MNFERLFSKHGRFSYSKNFEIPPRPKKYYKPFIHRHAAFASLVIITLGLLLWLEYTIEVLPHSTRDSLKRSSQTHLSVRQVRVIVPTDGGDLQATTFRTMTVSNTSTPKATFSSNLFTASRSEYSGISDLSAASNPTESAPIVSACLNSSVINTTSSCTNLDISALPSILSAPVSFVIPTISDMTFMTTAYTNDSRYTLNYGASAFLDSSIVTSDSLSMILTSVQDASAYSETAAGTTITATVASSASLSSSQYTVAINPLSTPEMTTPTLPLTSSLTTTYSSSLATDSAIAAISLKTKPTESSVLTITEDSSKPATLATGRPLTLLTGFSYFYGTYLAVLVAVIYRIIIGWLYSTTTMLEPLYMLKRDGGVRAKDFFNINYLSVNDTVEPYRAMLNGHWLMLWTFLLYTIVGALAPFSSEMMYFHRSCEDFSNGETLCGAALWIDPSIARIVEGLLTSVLVLLFVIWWLLRKRSSGVYSNPSSIASMCSLLHHPETMAEFQRLNQGASKEDTVRSLARNQYRLDTYKNSNGVELYGLIAARDYVNGGTHGPYESLESTEHHDLTVSSDLDLSHRQHYRYRKMLDNCLDLLLPLVTLGLLILIAYYFKDISNDGYNRFLSSQGFGPRFIITCVGVIIHTQWTGLDRQHSAFEPFRRLHSGHANPESTVLVSQSLFHITSFFSSLYRRDFFVALIAFVAITAEILIIVLPGVLFNSNELWRASNISSYLSMSILAFMLVILLAIWLRPKGPDLPRKPNTLGALCLYLCDSQLRFDFADLVYMKEEERNYAVRDMEKEYVLKCRLGSEGDLRWTVEYGGHD